MVALLDDAGVGSGRLGRRVGLLGERAAGRRGRRVGIQAAVPRAVLLCRLDLLQRPPGRHLAPLQAARLVALRGHISQQGLGFRGFGLGLGVIYLGFRVQC